MYKTVTLKINDIDKIYNFSKLWLYDNKLQLNITKSQILYRPNCNFTIYNQFLLKNSNTEFNFLYLTLHFFHKKFKFKNKMTTSWSKIFFVLLQIWQYRNLFREKLMFRGE